MMALRKPAESRPRGSVTASSASLPAPIKGINARDSVANMKPEDAIYLENMFPTPTGIALRSGYSEYATFTGYCDSIIIYTGLSATKEFVAVNNSSVYSIYDATSGGALSTAAVGGSGPTVQALTSARFDYQNFGTVGGQYLTLQNGADTPLQFDGTTWTASTMTGVTTSTLFTSAVYGERLWFGAKNTFNVWYLAVNSITGALTQLNLASLFKLGGSLNSIITVTDASNILTDYIGFLSTEGELVAFTGDDPSSPATWAKVAHLYLGRPVTRGNRTWVKYGADALVVCADGVVPIRRAIAADNRDSTLSISDRIRPLINDDVKTHGARYGWAITVHPTGSKIIVNVPTAENSTSRQWVMNTQHGAWCKFTGWNAFCFAISQDQLYFGGDGFFAKADQATAQDDAGASISVDVKQAFNYFRARGRVKNMKAMRPILEYNGPVSIAFSVDVDYGDVAPLNYIAFGSGAGDPWGGIWDAAWSGATLISTSWNTVLGTGHAIAPRMKMLATGINLTWSASDFLYEVGNAFG